MAIDPGASSSWWEWLGGLSFVAVSGLFAFTHKRIGEVEIDLKKKQVEEIDTLRQEIVRMEKSFKDRFAEGKEDRNEMWRAVRELQKTGAEQHSQNLEKLSKIPTREEMMQMLERFATHGRSTH